jgi:hypothetical protein
MIEIRFKYLNKIKFEKYVSELLIKHSVDISKTKMDATNCKLFIDTKEEDIKELLKDRLVSTIKQITKNK